jgi:putative transposase
MRYPLAGGAGSLLASKVGSFLASAEAPRSPNLNAFAERWVRSVKEECLSKLLLFGEASLRRALTQFQKHYHGERNHQGKGNVLLFPHGEELPKSRGPLIECRERLGGLLKYYHRPAA